MDAVLRFRQFYEPIHVPLVTCICIVGVVGHGLVIGTLTRNRKIFNPTNLMLMSMSLCQLTLLISYLCFTYINLLAERKCDPQFWHYGWVLSLWISINVNIFMHVSAVYHVVLMSIIRYLAITVYGNVWKANFLTWKRAVTCIGSIFLGDLLICIPTFLSSHVTRGTNRTWCRHSVNLTNYYHCSFQLDLNPGMQKFSFRFYAITSKLVPCILVFVMSLLLVLRLKKINKRRSGTIKNSVNQSRHFNRSFKQTTKIILAMMTIFLIVEIPQTILNFWVGFMGPSALPLYSYLNDFLEMVVVLYSSVNFSLFCSMSSQFRQSFAQLLTKMMCCFVKEELETTSLKHVGYSESQSQERTHLKPVFSENDFAVVEEDSL